MDYPLQYSWVSLVAQVVKNLPAMRETWLWSQGWEDPLKEGMATHYSCLENSHEQSSLVGHSPWSHKESDTTEQLSLSLSITNMMFIDVTLYSSCDLITIILWLWLAFKFSQTLRSGKCTNTKMKKNRWFFWDVEGRNGSRIGGMWPKHLGHRHLELTIILSP